MSAASVVLLDAHVHVYRCANPARMLDAAHANLSRAASVLGATRWDGLLLLTETRHDHWYRSTSRAGEAAIGRWTLRPVPGDAASLFARRDDGAQLAIVAGRQLVTRERLEMHAIGVDAEFADGLPLDAALAHVEASGALPVLPWGVGKWTGSRARLLDEILARPSNAGLALSDNGGRPAFWREPRLEHAASRVLLRGSDPLPIPGEERRVGTFGSWLRGSADWQSPARWCVETLRRSAPASLGQFGEHERAARMLRNQLLLRLRRY